MPIGVIESLDYEARGITRQDGKTIFVEGALPHEHVEYASFRKKSTYELAHLVNVLSPSASRVTPQCPHFGVCGGCAMQHLEPGSQLAVKQRVLEDTLWHIGRVRANEILPPIHGQPWAYRHRARLAVRKVSPTEVLIGFHERRSSFIADIRSCEVLPPAASQLLMPLRQLFSSLSVIDNLQQVDIAVGERCTTLLLRVLAPLSVRDEIQLRNFSDAHGIVFYLQPKGPDSVHLFYPKNAPALSYALPEFGVEITFDPADFTQVNHEVNRVLVRRALHLLDPQPGERIADLFCGLGNFTLPIARLGARVMGIEGNPAMLRRARESAQANGLGGQIEFSVANLFQCTSASMGRLGHFDKMLIDPPREGAIELIKAIGADAPRRIVYVSCNPASLARDAACLVNDQGYRLLALCAVNMFPQTAHVESISLFEKD